MVDTAFPGRRMAVVIRRSLLLLVLLTSAALSFGQDSTRLGNNDGSITIHWEALDTPYRIQVRMDGQIFIDTEQMDSELKLNLAPGYYEYRIHVLNPFGKDISVSEWQPLRVERSRTPYFRVQNPLVIWEGISDITMDVESLDLREGTIFSLTKGELSIPGEWQKNGNLYTVDLTGLNLEPGTWNLVAADPSGISFTHPAALIVRPTRSPEFKELSTRELIPEGIVPIAIEGEAFDPEMKVEFDGPGGKLKVITVDVSEGSKALVYLDLKDAKPGNYNLTVSNPSGDETRIDSILTITEPVLQALILEQPRFEFQIGYAPTWILVPDGENDLPIFLGFDFAALFHSGWKKPFFRGLGVEFRAFGGLSGPADPDNFEVHGIGSLDISGYYRPLVKGKTAPVFLLGIGNMWSGYADQFGVHNILYIRTCI